MRTKPRVGAPGWVVGWVRLAGGSAGVPGWVVEWVCLVGWSGGRGGAGALQQQQRSLSACRHANRPPHARLALPRRPLPSHPVGAGYLLDPDSPAALKAHNDRRAQRRLAQTAGARHARAVQAGWGDAQADAEPLNPHYTGEGLEDYRRARGCVWGSGVAVLCRRLLTRTHPSLPTAPRAARACGATWPSLMRIESTLICWRRWWRTLTRPRTPARCWSSSQVS